MKKILSLLLALLLTLSLIACNSQNDPEEPDVTTTAPNGNETTAGGNETTAGTNETTGSSTNEAVQNMTALELIEHANEASKQMTSFKATSNTKLVTSYGEDTPMESETATTILVTGLNPEDPTDHSKLAAKITATSEQTLEGETETVFTEIILVDGMMYMQMSMTGLTMKYKMSLDLAMQDGEGEISDEDLSFDASLAELFSDLTKQATADGYTVTFSEIAEGKMTELVEALLSMAESDGMGDATDTTVDSVSGSVLFDKDGNMIGDTAEFSLTLSAWECTLTCSVESSYEMNAEIPAIEAPADAATYMEFTEDEFGDMFPTE